MSAAVNALEDACKRLRDQGIPIRTWCGTRVLTRTPLQVQLVYGIEVQAYGVIGPSINAWRINPDRQPAQIDETAEKAIELIGADQ